MRYIKGEFTVVPSKSARCGLPPKLQVIYMWLCDYSDDNYESFPSRARLAKDCGISLRALDDGLNKLEQLNLIEKQQRIVDGEFTSNLYTVNIIALGSAKSAPPSAENGTTPSAKSAHRTQPNTNSTQLTSITSVIEDKPQQYGNTDINELFQYWSDKLGYTIEGNIKRNRIACSNLIRKHGIEDVKRLIDGVELAQMDKYAPRISNFVQLQSKQTDLIVWGKSRVAEQQSNKIVEV